MKMFIPAIGTRIKLTQPWTFTLHAEYRNASLYEVHKQAPLGDWWGHSYSSSPKDGPVQFTIPAGITILVDRIYIKKPTPEYNSVTFRIPKKCGNPPHIEGCRFWVKLDDANKVEGDVIV